MDVPHINTLHTINIPYFTLGWMKEQSHEPYYIACLNVWKFSNFVIAIAKLNFGRKVKNKNGKTLFQGLLK